jgi:PRTRC genetic system protein A
MMDKRDIALQLSCPVLPVPIFSEFVQASRYGERILVASNGVFIEVTRKWGRFIRRIGDVAVTVPYGEIQPSTSFTLPSLPRELLQEFNQLAKKNCNVEIGASIVWNEISNTFRLLPAQSLEATSDRLKYQLAQFEDGEHLVVDCHSHGAHKAFFSSEDDFDDRDMVKFSYVVGNCDREQVSTSLRLCVKGIFEIIF